MALKLVRDLHADRIYLCFVQHDGHVDLIAYSLWVPAATRLMCDSSALEPSGVLYYPYSCMQFLYKYSSNDDKRK